ncbi:MAG: amidohydrolase family protein [Armatimonadetes bacterium]|nr:amidohydrolase family protein [Armatimonadota bacterium]
MKIIDGHCHIGQGLTYSQTADELLTEMDRHGVSASVIVAADRFIAVYNTEGNNQVLSAAKDHPDRFIPFATANPWYGDEALHELRRAFDLGAKGLKLHPPLQGFQITDEIVFPLVELAVERGKPIYFHTGTPICSSPFQLTELAMRYPEGVFIMGHAAYADYWNDVTASVSCVPNIYIETSQHLASFVRTLIEQVGSDRIIYGSDSPLTSMALEIEKITRYVQSPEALESIFTGNIERVLGDGR